MIQDHASKSREQKLCINVNMRLQLVRFFLRCPYYIQLPYPHAYKGNGHKTAEKVYKRLNFCSVFDFVAILITIYYLCLGHC